MGKVIGNAWQRKEQERKRIQKVATLKKYARLCKAEGIDSRRVNTGVKTDDSERKSKEEFRGDSKEDENREKKSFKSKKPNKDQVVDKEEKKEQVKAQINDRIREMEESLEKRKKMKKELTKKTSRGQPVMKGRINHILGKLMKEAQQ